MPTIVISKKFILSAAKALGVYAISLMIISKANSMLITMIIVSCKAKVPRPPFSVEGEPNLFKSNKFTSSKMR